MFLTLRNNFYQFYPLFIFLFQFRCALSASTEDIFLILPAMFLFQFQSGIGESMAVIFPQSAGYVTRFSPVRARDAISSAIFTKTDFWAKICANTIVFILDKPFHGPFLSHAAILFFIFPLLSDQ